MLDRFIIVFCLIMWGVFLFMCEKIDAKWPLCLALICAMIGIWKIGQYMGGF